MDFELVNDLKNFFGSLDVALHDGRDVVIESARADAIHVEPVCGLHGILVAELVDVRGLLLRSKPVEGQVADLLEVVGGEVV